MMLIENNEYWKQPIEIMPLTQLFDTDPAMVTESWKEYQEKKVIVSEDHSRLFGVFSQKAIIVKHTDFVEQLQESMRRLYAEDLPITIECFDEGAKIVTRVALPEQYRIDIGNGDQSDLFLLGQNSYDHGYSFRLNLGVMRLVCSNGAVAPRTIDCIQAREFTERLKDKTVPARLARMVAKGTDLIDIWKSWIDISIDRVTADLILSKYFPKKFYEPILAAEEFPLSKYQLYNVLTRRSTHDINNSKVRWGSDNLISNIFYTNKVEDALKRTQTATPMIPIFSDEFVEAEVTETDDITH